VVPSMRLVVGTDPIGKVGDHVLTAAEGFEAGHRFGSNVGKGPREVIGTQPDSLHAVLVAGPLSGLRMSPNLRRDR